jgi:hypothetical protein
VDGSGGKIEPIALLELDRLTAAWKSEHDRPNRDDEDFVVLVLVR